MAYSFITPDHDPSDEELAVEAAMRGDQSKLAALIEAWAVCRASRAEPMPVIEPSLATWRLVVEFLRGDRSLSTGRRKDDEQRGRRKMSADERARLTPTHYAALEVSAVRRVLKAEYPDQGRAAIRDRALYAVARRHGIIDQDTPAYYLQRTRHNRRRIR